MANPAGRLPALEVGAWCEARDPDRRHLLTSSTEIYTYTSTRAGEPRVIRCCLHCHRRHSREAQAEIKAARRAGFARVTDYRTELRRREEEELKERKLSEAMAAWQARIRRPA